MEKKIDEKYVIQSFDSIAIVNRDSHKPIPDDEPLFLLRAKDIRALYALVGYKTACKIGGCDTSHLDGIDRAIAQFQKFRAFNPERIKNPDTPSTFFPSADEID